MRIVIKSIDLECQIDEGGILNIVIESPHLLSSVLWTIRDENENGNNGEIILCAEEEINWGKDVEILVDPFIMDVNNSKTLKKLYQEVENYSKEVLADSIAELNGQIMCFIERALSSIPYGVESGEELDIMGLLKLYNVKYEMGSDISILERIVNYLKVVRRINAKRIIIFKSLEDYLDEHEREELISFMRLEKITGINVTAHQPSNIVGEKTVIVDKDLCIIHL